MSRHYLSTLGVRNPLHQKILLDALPCGIKTARAAIRDKTAFQVNGPRALMVVHWKGMVAALIAVEERSAR